LDDKEVRVFQWKNLSAGSDSGATGDSGEFSKMFGPTEHAVELAPPKVTPEEVLARAHQDAELIVAVAHQEAENIRLQAREDGFAKGMADGHMEIRAKVERLETLMREMASFKSHLYEEAREEVVELVIAIAEKILGPLADGQPSAVVHVVAKGLELLSDRSSVTLRVHPDDVALVIESKSQLQRTIDGIRDLSVLEDGGVPRGGCMVESRSAEIDARLHTQLDEVIRAVRSV
jgi:flagellar assembly protein FliH